MDLQKLKDAFNKQSSVVKGLEMGAAAGIGLAMLPIIPLSVFVVAPMAAAGAYIAHKKNL